MVEIRMTFVGVGVVDLPAGVSGQPDVRSAVDLDEEAHATVFKTVVDASNAPGWVR